MSEITVFESSIAIVASISLNVLHNAERHNQKEKKNEKLNEGDAMQMYLQHKRKCVCVLSNLHMTTK